METQRIAAAAAYETTGRVWIGGRKASGPFVKLRARADDLSITTPIGGISFSEREVVALKPLTGVFGYGGFEIVHTVDRRAVQFWCRDVDVVRERIAATGFTPRGKPGSGPDPTRRARHEEENRRGNRGMFKLVASLIAFFGVIIGAIAVTLTLMVSHGEVYQTTWAAVQVDPRVVAFTGTPITSKAPSGDVSLVGSGGTAAIHYDISGPNGRGTVEAAGTKTEGRWRIDRFVFEPEGDEKRAIDLVEGQ